MKSPLTISLRKQTPINKKAIPYMTANKSNFTYMKTFKKLIVLAVVLLTTQFFAQTSPTYYVVLVKAKWCSTCIKNEDRVVGELLSKMDKNRMTVLTNDLTNKETKAASAEILRANGLEYVKLRSTGILFFVDARTKKIVESIPISKTTDELTKTVNRVTSL